MKTSRSITRISMLGSAVVMSLCLMQQAQAAVGDGICTPRLGIKQFPFSFTPTLTNPTENQKEKMFTHTWNLNDSYRLICNCPPRPDGKAAIMGAAYLWAKPKTLNELPGKIKGRTVYQLTNNLAMAAYVYIANKSEPAPVPVNGVSNDAAVDSGGFCSNARFVSGASGVVELFITDPFTGIEDIPSTQLLSISNTSTPNPTIPFEQMPVAAEVWISGQVTVPQSCSFDPSPIAITFDKPIMSNDFKMKGEMPDGFTEVHRIITLNCSNISEGVKVELTFSGAPDLTDEKLLKTTQDGIGIQIDGLDEGNRRIQIDPNGGSIPVRMDYNNGNINSQGVADIYVSPRNTTDKPAPIGDFSATATVNAVIP